MNPFARICATIHIASLGLWTGIVAMTAIAAAAIFPTVKALNPNLSDLNPSTPDQWLLVAGRTAAAIFKLSHVAQGTLAAVIVLSGAAMLAARKFNNSRCGMFGLASAAGAALVLTWYLLSLWPRMNTNLNAYWSHAQVGDLQLAAQFQQAFRADHPVASYAQTAVLLLSLTALLSAIWSLLPREDRA